MLGVDFGFKRIGLAVGESDPPVVTPRAPLAASGALAKDASLLDAIARQEQVDAIVIGLPLEIHGEGRMAGICRRLAAHLETLGQTVVLVDESLSSMEADNLLAVSGLKAGRRKRLRDGEAAAIILERYLDDEAKI